MTRWITIYAGILLLLVLAACSSVTPAQTTPAQVTPTTRPPVATAAPGSSASPSPRQAQTGTPGATPKASPTPTALVVTADGRLSYVDDRGLTFGTSGQIAHINVNELDKVSKGQILASLDTTSLDQAVKTAEFGVTAADFTYKSATADRRLAEAAVTSAQSDLKTMQANVKSAQIDLDQATDNFRKITYPYTYSTFVFDVPQALAYINDANRQIDDTAKRLQAGLTVDQYAQLVTQLQQALDNLTKGQQLLTRGQGADVFQSGTLNVSNFWTLRAAQLAVDKAQVAVENAQNSVDKTTAAIDNARNALAKAQIAEDKAKSDVDRARNDLDKAKFTLTQAIITAPFDGIVAKVNSKELDLISAGSYASTVVVEIVAPRHMELDVKISELDIPKAKLGQKATIRVDALPDQRVSAVVTSVASLPSVDNGVVSYLVKMTFDVPQDSLLKAGMAATADIGG